MRTRPRSKYVRKLKALRCPSCGASVNPQRKRCWRCSSLITNKPKK